MLSIYRDNATNCGLGLRFRAAGLPINLTHAAAKHAQSSISGAEHSSSPRKRAQEERIASAVQA